MDNALLSKTIDNGYFNLDFERSSINNGGKIQYYFPKKQLGS